MAHISGLDKFVGRDISLFNKQGSPVASSSNQSGGITANTVNFNVNQPQEPFCDFSDSEKTESGEWLTKLTVRGVGLLPLSNWNILLEFNADIIHQEEEDVSAGPWQPLQINKQLLANQKFIGFNKIDPGQHFTLIFYSKEPLKITRAQKIST